MLAGGCSRVDQSSTPSVRCPECGHVLGLKDLRAGRFRVACPRCRAPLVLAVALEPAPSVAVEVEARPTPPPEPVPAAAVAPVAVPVPAGAPRWLGRYRVVGGWGAARAGLGVVGRWLGVGPAVGVAATRDRWEADPRFVARWALEALGSGQLRHPNLIAPYEVGATADRLLAASAPGRFVPLADLVRGRGDLDRQARVAAVLHAARGLRHAHEQGVYHRDLALDAIGVDPDGRVAVLGVGVGLTPGVAPPAPPPIPLAGEAPPPPIPEPAAQADVAGLGRVLGSLLGGPDGSRAVPPGLATLARLLTGEGPGGMIDPRERLNDMGAAVRALEAEAGVDASWQPTPAEAEAFAAAVDDYHAAPLAPARRWAEVGVAGFLGLIALLLLVLGRVLPALGWAAFGGLIAAALAGWRGLGARDRVGDRVAPALAALGRRDLGSLVAVAVLLVGTLAVTHLLVMWGLLAILAVGLAAALHFGVDRPLESSRGESLDRLRALVRGWRRLGADEAAIRRFVAGAGGQRWEEPFAELYGLAAVAPARGAWGLDLSGRRRARFAPARAWALHWFDEALADRADERARALLEAILERDIEARGAHVLTARRRSKRAAEAVVAVARQYRRSADGSVGLPLVEAFRRAADRPEEFLHSPEIAEEAGPPRWRALAEYALLVAFGPRSRFLLGAACLAGAVVWMEQNDLLNYEQAKQAAATATVEGDRARAVDQAKAIGDRFVGGVARLLDAPDPGEPMQLGVVPPGVAEHLNGFALAASGLILLASSTVGGLRVVPVALVAALLPLGPRLVQPSARPLDPISLGAMGLGVALYVVGLAWARRGEG